MDIKDKDPLRQTVAVPVKTGKSGPRATPKSHHSFAKKSEKSSLKPWLYSIILLLLLWKAAGSLRNKPEPQQIRETVEQAGPASEETPEISVPGGVMLKADASGHFRGMVMINKVSMPFMIDTGATLTVIPERMAVQAGLPFGRKVQTSTAGGRVIDHLTRIDSLQLGNAELHNIHASINQHMEEVLIGMSALKYFQITQNHDTLTLVAANDPEEASELAGDLPLASPSPKFAGENRNSADNGEDLKPEKTWKKSVSCDAQQNCTPKYGDR